MKKYRYIFWDLDGTISDSYEGISNCVKYALKFFDINLEDPAVLRNFIGPPLRVSFPTYAGLNPEDTERAVKLYRERYDPIGVYECEMYPDVKETLTYFKEAGYLQVLASSKPEARCREVLEQFGIKEYFDEIVGASPDGHIDSKLQVLNEAFRRLREADPDFSLEKTVLIGDTHYDADGAAAAGIDCIGITYGFGSREELINSGACGIFDSLPELVEAFRNN